LFIAICAIDDHLFIFAQRLGNPPAFLCIVSDHLFWRFCFILLKNIVKI